MGKISLFKRAAAVVCSFALAASLSACGESQVSPPDPGTAAAASGLACAASGAGSIDALSSWAGEYSFLEYLSPDEAIVMAVYNITVYPSEGGYRAQIDIAPSSYWEYWGMDQLIADVRGDAGSIDLVFASYGDGRDAFSVEYGPYHPGDVLLTLEKQGAEILTTWDTTHFGPSIHQNPGNYFRLDTSPYTAAFSAYKAVLLKDAEFCDTADGQFVTMSQYIGQMTRCSIPPRFPKFSVADMNRDGTPEVVLWRSWGGGNEFAGTEILSYQDGVVYCYSFFDFREMQQIKTDGTFHYTGGTEAAGLGTLTLSKESQSLDRFTYFEPSGNPKGPDVLYYVNHEAATAEDYGAAAARQAGKTDVTWYDFGPAAVMEQLSRQA